MKLCICTVCSAEFARKRNTTGKFCSRRCAWLDRGGPAFNARIAVESAERRGDAQRGRGAGKAYRKRGGKHEHRAIGEQIAGRALRQNEIVHHRDEDKQNNDPGNLEVVTKAEHMRLHGMGIPGVAPAWKPWEKRWGKGGQK